MEFLLHPVTMTLVMSAILVTLQVLGQAALAKLTPEQATRWPALALPALLVVMTSIVVVPTINHLWAERRDVQNEERVHHRDLDAQRREVRDAHLDRLRPLLLSDSKKLLQLSSRLAVDGTAIGGLFVDDYESRLDHEFWYPEVVYRDLAAHFPDYAKVRERVRGEVFEQQKEFHELERLATELAQKIVKDFIDNERAAESPRTNVGGLMALRLERAARRDATSQSDDISSIAVTRARHCIGIGKGMNLDVGVDPGGHGAWAYTDDAGGSQGGPIAPPAYLVRRMEAYKAFRPTERFKASCDTVKERYKRLATELRTLSTEAAIAAESPALFGDCSYVRLF